MIEIGTVTDHHDEETTLTTTMGTREAGVHLQDVIGIEIEIGTVDMMMIERRIDTLGEGMIDIGRKIGIGTEIGMEGEIVMIGITDGKGFGECVSIGEEGSGFDIKYSRIALMIGSYESSKSRLLLV